MRIAIHLSPSRTASQEFLTYERILQYNQIESVRVHIDDIDFWDKIKECDAFVFNWHHFDDQKQIATTILPVIENEYQIKCFPDYKTSWHYDDKVKQYYLLKKYNIPIIESWIFFNKSDALNWLSTAKFPVVFKLKSGAGSLNVALVRTFSEGRKLILKMFTSGAHYGKLPIKDTTASVDFNLYKYARRILGNVVRKIKEEGRYRIWAINMGYVMFQKFIPNNFHDTRIIVIGNHAYGEKRLNRENDFRASGGGRLIFDKEEIDLQFVKLAFEISKKMKFQSMAYDFMYDVDGSPVICEISYTFPHQLFYEKCPGHWDENLVWHEGNYSPQLFELEILLGTDLLQPDFFKNPIPKVY
ncbi:MAG: hypothetical protein K9I71_03365 [Ignavibacteriales bacterium]|nr:hypothetical protein [Melioribacteraceae bacterium]MCF8315133.1 hypothetical protein [Ignavibacteriales bacterium]MCF8435871.1 hypothetical protein [Ignavibacteriales bacterium]